MNERTKGQEKQETKIIYPMPYISRYDQYGKRRSYFIRFLMTVKESIFLAMDASAIPTGKSPLSKHIPYQMKSAHPVKESAFTSARMGIDFDTKR